MSCKSVAILTTNQWNKKSEKWVHYETVRTLRARLGQACFWPRAIQSNHFQNHHADGISFTHQTVSVNIDPISILTPHFVIYCFISWRSSPSFHR